MQNAVDAPHELESPAIDFFTKKTITKALKPKPKRFVPPFKITGNLMHEKNVQQLTAAANTIVVPLTTEDKEKDTPRDLGRVHLDSANNMCPF
ncbi:hypothetical protein DPMN_064487 [Dreissena polymorpha]|uniref:Uncharacterized protein n=1 Tax=Dreissena polymorpha TaxID=45954 RepID=A0A9D4CDP1_DREPO|nr:hypothetical protein DPMN_064486 [Dreissena polymorpha]KAH3721558.1 hypothetical protein DPMN_064487 [Dreissena polymorpha]